MVDIIMNKITNENKLPKGCNKIKATEICALRIVETDIDELMEKIRRRNQ